MITIADREFSSFSLDFSQIEAGLGISLTLLRINETLDLYFEFGLIPNTTVDEALVFRANIIYSYIGKPLDYNPANKAITR